MGLCNKAIVQAHNVPCVSNNGLHCVSKLSDFFPTASSRQVTCLSRPCPTPDEETLLWVLVQEVEPSSAGLMEVRFTTLPSSWNPFSRLGGLLVFSLEDKGLVPLYYLFNSSSMTKVRFVPTCIGGGYTLGMLHSKWTRVCCTSNHRRVARFKTNHLPLSWHLNSYQ